MHWQTVAPLLAVVALATALPAGPQKRQAYYFSPSSIYNNPYFGYSSYPSGPIPYTPPSLSQRYLLLPQTGAPASHYNGPYSPMSMSGVEHIPPPPPGSYPAPPAPPPPYQTPEEYSMPNPSPVHLAIPSGAPFNGGLLLVPLRDETIGGSGGSGTDYISVLTNYLNQWIASKPPKPDKPPAGEKPYPQTGSGNKTPEAPEKAEKPEGEAKPETAPEAKPEPSTEAPNEAARPPSQRFLVITPPQLLNNPPAQDPSKAASTYLILNQGSPFNAPQRRYFDPYPQSPQFHHPSYPPNFNTVHQPATGRSAMPEFVLGKSENKYGFIHPSFADSVNPNAFAAPIPERRSYQPFYSQRRAFEDYGQADSVSVESAVKDSSNAAVDDSSSTTTQPAANGTSTDEEVVESGELGPSIAQVKPAAIALAGPGGVAAAAPVGTALVGPGGMALAAPSATAVAGPSGSAPAVVPAAANAFANPSTFRKPIKNKGQSDRSEYDVIQESRLISL